MRRKAIIFNDTRGERQNGCDATMAGLLEVLRLARIPQPFCIPVTKSAMADKEPRWKNTDGFAAANAAAMRVRCDGPLP